MKKTWRYFIGNKYYLFRSFKVYWAFKQYEADQIREKDLNESFTGQFLKAGFSTLGIGFNQNENNPSFFFYDKKIIPSINWFGTSRYAPDTIFKKNDVELIMSLHGILTPYNKEYNTLFDEKSVRYISVKKGGIILYQDWTGNLPPKELITSIL